MALKVSRKHYHKGKLCSKKSWTCFLVLSGYLAEYRQNLIYAPNIPDSYVILFFIASDFTFTTTDIHNWVLFRFGPATSLRAISSCLLLFPSSILAYWTPSYPGDSSSSVISFCLFILFTGLLKYQTHLTCLLRNLSVKTQQLELDMEQLTGSKLGKEYNKAVYCHPAYLTYMQSISCKY